MTERTVQLVLHYDGAGFSGWQRQPERRTVQGVLEAVLARAKQSSEQEDLPSANFRVLSPAVPAIRIAYPPTIIVLLGALVAGIFFGCVSAWLRDRFGRARSRPEGSLA